MDSNHADFLRRARSNQVPPEEELHRIRSLRQECRAGIDAIDRQIDQLIAQRKHLEDDLEQYESLLSPIKRVPVDILSTIFQHAATIPHQLRVLPTLVASTVCRDWRKLAFTTPTLWSTIVILIPAHPRLGHTFGDTSRPNLVEEEERMWERQMKKLLANTQLWIDRSKECPVTLTLKFTTVSIARRNGWGGQDSPAAALPLYQALVDLACSVAHRWREVDLSIITGDNTVVQAILSLEPRHIPQLESISFQTGDKHRVDDPNFYPAGLLGAQSLRSAFLLNVGRPWTQLSINWASLKKLQFAVRGQWLEVGDNPKSVIKKALGPRGLLSLLQACPNLEHCEVAVRSADEDQRDWQMPVKSAKRTGVVRMVRMRSTKFHGSEPVEELMSSLELPSLQQLHFLASFVGEMVQGKRSILTERFLCAVGRFGSQLTDIRFSFLLLEETTSVNRCLGNLPNLLNLQLDSAIPATERSGKDMLENLEHAGKFLLDALTPGMDEGGPSVGRAMCPKLKRFACTLRMKGFTESQLLKFIASRSGQGGGDSCLAQIEEVDVAFGIMQGMNIRTALEEEGVDIGSLTIHVQYAQPRLFLAN